jgi:hypothetical protein
VVLAELISVFLSHNTIFCAVDIYLQRLSCFFIALVFLFLLTISETFF